MQVVRAARGASPPIETMVFTAFGSVEAAVEAMRLGALDFLTKPVTADQLLDRVRKVAAGVAHEEEDFLGTSDSTQLLRAQAERARKVRSTVLITGEIGSGRKHLAHWLHRHGLDADRPFLRMRAGAPVPEGELRAAGTVLVPGFDDWNEIRAARAPAEPGDARGRRTAARDRDGEPRGGDEGRAGRHPARALLPPGGAADQGAAAPRAPEGHRDPRRALPRRLRAHVRPAATRADAQSSSIACAPTRGRGTFASSRTSRSAPSWSGPRRSASR